MSISIEARARRKDGATLAELVRGYLSLPRLVPIKAILAKLDLKPQVALRE